MQNAFIGYLAVQIKGIVDRLVRLVDRLVLIVDRLVLPYQFIHSRPSSRYVSVGKEVEELLISLSIKEKLCAKVFKQRGGLRRGGGRLKANYWMTWFQSYRRPQSNLRQMLIKFNHSN